MHTRTVRAALVAGVAALTLTACGGTPVPTVFDELGADRDAVPAHQVTGQEGSISAGVTRQKATLIVPDATVDSATAALADWASKTDAQYLEAETVRGDDDATYVCNLRLATSDQAARLLMGGDQALRLNCPGGM